MKLQSIDLRNNNINQLYYFVFLFAVGLYINTIGHDYAFDDTAVLSHAKYGLKELFTNDLFSPVYGQPLDIGVRWRPLLVLTFAIENELFGSSPFIGHAINVILYGFAAIVLFIILLKMFPKAHLLAFVSTLIFIAHPLHTEVVANIKSRDEILAFLFLMLTFFFLIKFTNSDKKKYLGYGCLTYSLALLSKEISITFLAIIPLFLFCFTNKNWKQSFILVSPFFILVGAYLALRASIFFGYIIGDQNQDALENHFYGVPLANKFATIFYIMGKYFRLLCFPHSLACDYSFNQIPITNWMDPGAYLPALLCLVFLGFAVKTIWNFRKTTDESQLTSDRWTVFLAFCILFYFITLSITSNAFFNIGAPMAERFLFLPSLGFAIAVAIIMLKLLNIRDWHELNLPPALYGVLIVVLLAFSFKTISRNMDWENNLTLFGKDVQTVPNSAKIHYYYGGELVQRSYSAKSDLEKLDFLNKALSEEKIAVGIYPKFYVAYYTMGLIYEDRQMADSAIYYYTKVLELEPRYTQAYGKLGFLYGMIKGDADSAVPYFLKGLEKDPDNALWGLQLGVAYGMKKMYAEAIRVFGLVKGLDPQQEYQCNLNIGTAYFLLGKHAEALGYFQGLLQVAPQDAVVLQKVGETYQALGDTMKAGEYFARMPKE